MKFDFAIRLDRIDFELYMAKINMFENLRSDFLRQKGGIQIQDSGRRSSPVGQRSFPFDRCIGAVHTKNYKSEWSRAMPARSERAARHAGIEGRVCTGKWVRFKAQIEGSIEPYVENDLLQA